MFRVVHILAIMFIALTSTMLSAQSDSVAVQGSRPKVGVVLSGGGAKGIAHLGVLKVLEEQDIPIDYICGTSMGSFVGVLYSAGYSVDSIMSILGSLDKDALSRDRIPRDFIDFRERDDYEKYIISANFDDNFGINIPKGAVIGQNLNLMMNKYLWNYLGDMDFSDMPIPYFCIGADIISGKHVVLDKGNIVDAVRASIAVPLIFTPVQIDSMLLVDGGIYNNFPTKEMKDKGVDIIIGVNVGFEPHSQTELKQIAKVVDQLMWVNNVDNNKKAKQYCDILIEPDVDNISSSSFKKISDIYNIGKESAMEQISSIDSLSKYLNIHKTERAKHLISEPRQRYITTFEVNGLVPSDENVFYNYLQLNERDYITSDEISMAILHERGELDYNSITYTIKSDSVIVFDVEKKENKYSGQIGLNFDTYSYGKLKLNFNINKIFSLPTDININGEICRNPSLEFNYLYTIDKIKSITHKGNSSFSFGFTGSLKNDNIYRWENLERNTDERSTAMQAKIYLQREFRFHYMYSAGISYVHHKIKIPRTSVINESVVFLYYTLKKDRIDNTEYPSRGASYEIKAEIQAHTNGYYPINISLQGNYKKAIPISKSLYFTPGVKVGINTAPNTGYASKFYIGGETTCNTLNSIPLYGYNICELAFNNVVAGYLNLRWNVHKNHNILLLPNISLGADNFTDIFRGEDIFCGSGIGLGYSFNSFIGPFEIIISKAFENKSPTIWANIGYHF